MNYFINCNNHTCELRIGCQNYMNKSGEQKYCRPMIKYNENETAIYYCDNLLPFNVEYIVKQSKMNPRVKAHKLNVKYEIVAEFGGNAKRKLMKLLDDLMK